MCTILVNNPAARSGGALTILKEFLEKISTLECNRKFYIFVSLDELKKYENKNIKIIVLPQQGFINRILWDNFGLKKYLNQNNIYPKICLSIQNTGVNLNKKIPQIIYYHQPLSIVELNWNILKKEERIFWIYKNIYPFFIKQHLNKVRKVIVQTEWVKEGFNKNFNYSIYDIAVVRPEIKKINVDSIKSIPKNKFRIFYPATPLVYKNHKIIIEALGLLKKEKDIEDIECIFTFDKSENLELDSLIKKYGLEESIKLVGKIPYKKVLEYYKSSDLLVFPSYLETLGLPLLEAQQFNLPIVALDLPYVREVVGNYRKVEFLDLNNLWWKNVIKMNIEKYLIKD